MLDSGPESRDTGIEDNEDNDDEDEDVVIVPSDWSPESNCGVKASDIRPSEDPGRHNNLPILAQPVTTHVSQDVSLPEPSSPSESSIPPPSAPPLIQRLTPNVPAHCVPSEGGESPSQLGDWCHCAETSPILPASIPYVSPHQTHSLSRSASQPSATLQPDWSKSVEEWLADAKRMNLELKHKIEELKMHCYFTGDSVKWLQKQVNTKQAQKGALICAKNINVDARVLTSVEGHHEVQWLCKEATEKEWLLNECQELDGSGLLGVSEAVMLEVKCQWY